MPVLKTNHVISGSNSTNKLRYYIQFFMVGVYLALGLLFLFTDIGFDLFPANRTPVGIILIVYASFRVILIVQKIRKADKE